MEAERVAFIDTVARPLPGAPQLRGPSFDVMVSPRHTDPKRGYCAALRDDSDKFTFGRSEAEALGNLLFMLTKRYGRQVSIRLLESAL